MPTWLLKAGALSYSYQGIVQTLHMRKLVKLATTITITVGGCAPQTRSAAALSHNPSVPGTLKAYILLYLNLIVPF